MGSEGQSLFYFTQRHHFMQDYRKPALSQMSIVQKYCPLIKMAICDLAFIRSCFLGCESSEGSPQKGCVSLLLPHKCLQFSSASLNRGNAPAGKVCLCVTVCKMLEETGFCICILPLLKN